MISYLPAALLLRRSSDGPAHRPIRSSPVSRRHHGGRPHRSSGHANGRVALRSRTPRRPSGTGSFPSWPPVRERGDVHPADPASRSPPSTPHARPHAPASHRAGRPPAPDIAEPVAATVVVPDHPDRWRSDDAPVSPGGRATTERPPPRCWRPPPGLHRAAAPPLHQEPAVRADARAPPAVRHQRQRGRRRRRSICPTGPGSSSGCRLARVDCSASSFAAATSATSCRSIRGARSWSGSTRCVPSPGPTHPPACRRSQHVGWGSGALVPGRRSRERRDVQDGGGR